MGPLPGAVASEPGGGGARDADGDAGGGQGVEDLVGGLASQQFDVTCGQAEVDVRLPQQGFAEGDRLREPPRDGASLRPLGDAVSFQEAGDVRVGVQRRQELVLVTCPPRGAGSAAAHRDAEVV